MCVISTTIQSARPQILGVDVMIVNITICRLPQTDRALSVFVSASFRMTALSVFVSASFRMTALSVFVSACLRMTVLCLFQLASE